MKQEAGGHRWQRIPPTESKGRVHTSTVTVAVIELPDIPKNTLFDRDIVIVTTKDGGPGGQHRNKVESCVIMTHKPTGITAKSATKSQHYNKKVARAILEQRVAEHYGQIHTHAQDIERRQQVGSGMRGDKIRTYRSRDNTVINHASGKKARLTDVLEGKLEKLW